MSEIAGLASILKATLPAIINRIAKLLLQGKELEEISLAELLAADERRKIRRQQSIAYGEKIIADAKKKKSPP